MRSWWYIAPLVTVLLLVPLFFSVLLLFYSTLQAGVRGPQHQLYMYGPALFCFLPHGNNYQYILCTASCIFISTRGGGYGPPIGYSYPAIYV